MTRMTYGSSSLVVVLPLLVNLPMIPLPALPRPSAALLDVFLRFENKCDPPPSRRLADDEADVDPMKVLSPRRNDMFS